MTPERLRQIEIAIDPVPNSASRMKYELIAEVKRLDFDIHQILDVLRSLYDYQNGCPLPQYIKQWTAAMASAKHVLDSHGM